MPDGVTNWKPAAKVLLALVAMGLAIVSGIFGNVPLWIPILIVAIALLVE